MIEISVFPKTFFGVEVPKDLNERVLNVVKGLDYCYDHFPHPLVTDTKIHELPELDFYIDYLNEQILEIKEKQNLSCDKLSIFTMWANKSTAGRYGSRHNHPMSWWSFIHYLTEGSPTYFFDHHSETPWMQLGEHNNTSIGFQPGVSIPVGSILFFPSWVPHQVESQEKNDRYSIAGNTFPEGHINPARMPDREYLNIKLQ